MFENILAQIGANKIWLLVIVALIIIIALIFLARKGKASGAA